MGAARPRTYQPTAVFTKFSYSSPLGRFHFYRAHKTKLLTVSLLYAPLGAQPVAHSTVVSSTIVYVLRTIRSAIGSDRGDLP